MNSGYLGYRGIRAANVYAYGMSTLTTLEPKSTDTGTCLPVRYEDVPARHLPAENRITQAWKAVASWFERMSIDDHASGL